MLLFCASNNTMVCVPETMHCTVFIGIRSHLIFEPLRLLQGMLWVSTCIVRCVSWTVLVNSMFLVGIKCLLVSGRLISVPKSGVSARQISCCPLSSYTLINIVKWRTLRTIFHCHAQRNFIIFHQIISFELWVCSLNSVWWVWCAMKYSMKTIHLLCL